MNDELTRIQFYKSGAADIATVTPDRWKDVNGTVVKGEHTLQLIIRKDKPRLTIQYVMFNTQREPFNIKEVRQALAYAIPYSTILKTIFADLYVPLSTVVPKGMPGYTEFNIIKYTYNITKAREIINKLKTETGFDPAKYTIKIYYNTGNTARAQIAALLQNAWSGLGFKVVVETYAWPVFLDKVDNFDYDVALLGWVPDYLDPDNYLTPFVWGGAEFTETNYYANVNADQVGNYLSKIDREVETEKYYVIIGPKGTGATFTKTVTKPLLVVNYVLDQEKTNKNWEKPYAFVSMNPSNWRDVATSALTKLSKKVLDPEIRVAIIQAAVIIFNNEVPMPLLGQAVTGENHGSWVKDMYYPLTTFARYDLVWEPSNAPVEPTGIKDINNDAKTMVIATIGWPDTFDTAKSYETFGWEIFTQIYTPLVVFEKELTDPSPGMAAAWAFSSDATELYLLIRSGVKAYDPWNKKLYDITAVDALFSLWRVARAALDPSWLINDFIDVNASSVLTVQEFQNVLAGGLTVPYKGKSYTVNNLNDLLNIFGYKGQVEGVVKLQLHFPYPPILTILTTGAASVISMQYALGDKYNEALAASNNGKNPSAWANYVKPGEDDPVHKLFAEKPISTGPYYVAEYKEDQYILLKINPYYWNAQIWEELYGYRPTPSISLLNSLELSFEVNLAYIRELNN
jgi:peptide/nickel transport system substrate-binding protein